MTSFDNLHICRCQLYGCPVTLETTAVNRPTPALEKVRQDVSEARGHARNHREQPCSISFNEVRLMLDALNWTGDHWWSFSFSPQDFVCEIASRQFASAHFYVTIVLVACFVCASLLSGQLIVFLLVHLIILVPFASKGSLEDAILVRVKLLVLASRRAYLDADRSGLGFVSVHHCFLLWAQQNLQRLLFPPFGLDRFLHCGWFMRFGG